MITIRDVARKSGFSEATVSIVMNNGPLARLIPLKTQKKVRSAARQLDYHPNLFARALVSRRSHTVGLIVFDIADPYCSQILRGIGNTLYQSSYLPLLTDIQNHRPRFKRYLEMLLERRIEGLIAIANSLFLEPGLLEAFVLRKIPTVIIGQECAHRFMHSVVIHNEAGTRAAIEHLYALGHRHIAFIKGPTQVADSSRRWRGICEFAQQAGLELDSKLVVEISQPASSYRGGHEATRALLHRRRHFSALLAFDDVTAFGAIRALNQSGRKVPQDCSVVGFDDVAMAAFYTPPLTTIRQPMEALGVTSVEILTEAVRAARAKEPFVTVHQKIKPALVVRESTSALEHA